VLRFIAFSVVAITAFAAEPSAVREDAAGIEALVNQKYGYLERLPNGRFELTEKLRIEAEAVNTPRDLVRYAEKRSAR
jgi:hypothetical protein